MAERADFPNSLLLTRPSVRYLMREEKKRFEKFKTISED